MDTEDGFSKDGDNVVESSLPTWVITVVIAGSVIAGVVVAATLYVAREQCYKTFCTN